MKQKIIQIDARGQIVIPKEIRKELDLGEGTGFFVLPVKGEGIFLKKIKSLSLKSNELKNITKEVGK